MDAFKVDVMEFAAGQGKLYLGPDALAAFCATQRDRGHRIFLLTDTNTHRDCRPTLLQHLTVDTEFTFPAGESNKNLARCADVWQALTDAHFSRNDVLINLGGGVVCDLGGFAASTYKRGIRFVHIPTTLLAMADAAIGGKTGIDFAGFKNQVGTFQQPAAVVIHPLFLETLPDRQIRSGFAEVMKHLLIHDRAAWNFMVAVPGLHRDYFSVIDAAVRIKLHFTEADPLEANVRKALNFGHTVGHALESHFLASRPADGLLHGEAVAVGMWCEAWLSLQRGLLPPTDMAAITAMLQANFSKTAFSPAEIPAIAQWALQDKKNAGGQILAVLLHGIGQHRIDQTIDLQELEASLAAYQASYS